MTNFINNHNNRIYDTVNGGFILLNFPDEKKQHGCRFACPYCGFKSCKKYQKLLYPSHDAVDRFLACNRGLFIKLSGGGDPLYNYETNKEKILDLMNYIHNKGRKIFVTTREVDTILKYHNTELNLVENWSISVDGCYENVHECLKVLKEAGKSAMVSMVYTPGQTDRDSVRKVAKYYSDVTWRILIASNYFYNMESDWEEFGNELMKMTNGIAKTKIVDDDDDSPDVLTLIGEDIMFQGDVNKDIEINKL